MLSRTVLKLSQIFFVNCGHVALGSTYAIRHRIIAKRVVDFLFVLIELFSLAVTAEALRAKID